MATSRHLRAIAAILFAVAQLGGGLAWVAPAGSGAGHHHGVMHLASAMPLSGSNGTPAPDRSEQAPCCPDCHGSLPCPPATGHLCLAGVGCASLPAITLRPASGGQLTIRSERAQFARWAAITAKSTPETPPPRV